ncbi:MAG: 2-oxo acid dehydrogenase subunit E2, partial [Acidobacteria bacterium]|nr:2-oxo acid dehydrogenase subunit E2 [Acidobacteriota bacterium]
PGRTSRREAMTPLRRTIARRLLQARQETAMLTTINEVDMTAVQAVRRANQDAFTRKYGVKLGYMSFFARAVCLALAEVPVVNASAGEDFIDYHDFVDLSVAVATPRGLVVPVVRNAQALGVPQLETAIQAFAKKAREGRLSLDEMTGGTFTLTNGGTFGSLISTPLINPPQSAILGMHVIQDRPVARDGQVVIRPMMYVSLSYDHRLVDGKESVQFVVKVKDWLEHVSVASAGL